MALSTPAAPIVVGIDGSDAALHAALWAVDEAVARQRPLRLVYAMKPRHDGSEDYNDDVHRARTSLQSARSAVRATGKQVDVETAVVDGPPAIALIGQSGEAEMLCVGTVGIGHYAKAILGSTAVEIAEKAHCPVAVIRPQRDGQEPAIDWIVVAAGDRPDNPTVVDRAMQEARLRNAPVLVLGDRRSAGESPDAFDGAVAALRERYPDVHVYPLDDESDVTHFLKKHHERVQLAVIGDSDTEDLAAIVGPHGHPVFRHAHSSALVVRP